MNEILHSRDYGIIGDGVTDDGPAITAAVRDAIAKHATLLFEGDQTYRIETGGEKLAYFSSPFTMQNANGVTIDGGGSRFVFAPDQNYFILQCCRDITVRNMRFDLAVTPYLVGRVKSVDGALVTYETDLAPYAPDVDYSGTVAFSIKYNEGTQRRPHRFLTHMTQTGPLEVEITYVDDTHGYQAGDLVFIPNPGIGHFFSERVFVGGHTGFLRCENLSIYAATGFIFSIRGNDAEMFFDCINVAPDQTKPRQIEMVAWRDCYHCKDNRKPIHWSHCRTAVCFDDVFNVRNSLGRIRAVLEDSTLIAVNEEFDHYQHVTVPFDGRVGDVIDLYDYENNRFCGTAEIASVATDPSGASRLTLTPLSPLDVVNSGCVIGNRATCAPGSTICDSHFTGTFRFTRDMTISHTVFDHLYTWLMAEGDVEGPLPGNIRYVNCDICGGTLEIGSPCSEIPPHFGPIVLEGCRITDLKTICPDQVNLQSLPS